jgi:hypothetical protein
VIRAGFIPVHFNESVTVERRIVVGLEDIQVITLECLACGSRLSLSPDITRTPPEQCPSCFKDWMPLQPAPSSSLASPLVSFALSLQRIRNLHKEGVNLGFRILLEFREPE